MREREREQEVYSKLYELLSKFMTGNDAEVVVDNILLQYPALSGGCLHHTSQYIHFSAHYTQHLTLNHYTLYTRLSITHVTVDFTVS